MAVPDVYQADQWHDYFLMVGGAAAALTGLVFVALSINLGAVTKEATHHYRAVGTLVGFAAAFFTCGLALMGGQGHIAVGIEWTVVALSAAAVYLYGYFAARRTGTTSVGLGRLRVGLGTGLYLVELVGAGLIIAGQRAGLYLAAVSMTALIAFSISGAWLLIVGPAARTDPAA